MNSTARGLVVGVLIVVFCLVAYSFWMGSWRGASAGPQPPAAVASGRVSSPVDGGPVDVEKARERGAKIGERLAIATNKVTETAEESAITAKVKAKMAFDDQVKARRIDVTTNGSTITLDGIVESATEHNRAVALARETSGVTNVVDHLVTRQ